VVAATAARGILLGSFVIAQATVDHLRGVASDVTIVAMGHNAIAEADEDAQCARYLESLLRGERPTPPTVLLEGDHAADGWPDWFPRRDAELACQIDRFDFALPVAFEAGLFVARAALTAAN